MMDIDKRDMAIALLCGVMTGALFYILGGAGSTFGITGITAENFGAFGFLGGTVAKLLE